MAGLHPSALRTPADSPKVDVLVPVPRVRVGLLPNSPVPVPKDGALVVVVPNPAVLLNKLCCNRQTQRNIKMMFTHTDSSVTPGVKTGQAQGECEVLRPAGFTVRTRDS